MSSATWIAFGVPVQFEWISISLQRSIPRRPGQRARRRAGIVGHRSGDDEKVDAIGATPAMSSAARIAFSAIEALVSVCRRVTGSRA